jgi:hypothetical protein
MTALVELAGSARRVGQQAVPLSFAGLSLVCASPRHLDFWATAGSSYQLPSRLFSYLPGKPLTVPNKGAHCIRSYLLPSTDSLIRHEQVLANSAASESNS